VESATESNTDDSSSGTENVEGVKRGKVNNLPTFLNSNVIDETEKFKPLSSVVDIYKYVQNNGIGGDIKLSAEFKQVSAQLVLELVYSIGTFIKNLAKLSKTRSITPNVVNAGIEAYHIAYNFTNINDTDESINQLVNHYNLVQTGLKTQKQLKKNTQDDNTSNVIHNVEDNLSSKEISAAL
jgi:hypothetical protein